MILFTLTGANVCTRARNIIVPACLVALSTLDNGPLKDIGRICAKCKQDWTTLCPNVFLKIFVYVFNTKIIKLLFGKLRIELTQYWSTRLTHSHGLKIYENISFWDQFDSHLYLASLLQMQLSLIKWLLFCFSGRWLDFTCLFLDTSVKVLNDHMQ